MAGRQGGAHFSSAMYTPPLPSGACAMACSDAMMTLPSFVRHGSWPCVPDSTLTAPTSLTPQTVSLLGAQYTPARCRLSASNQCCRRAQDCALCSAALRSTAFAAEQARRLMCACNNAPEVRSLR